MDFPDLTKYIDQNHRHAGGIHTLVACYSSCGHGPSIKENPGCTGTEGGFKIM